jgi:hypothetical protein
VFISYSGTIGAAYGTLFTYSIMFVANQIYLNRQFGITLWGVLVQTVAFYRSIPSRLNGRHGEQS